ncbi:hypothetical protein R1sor_008187 [Riccia sorocarpa]|uniref:Uncharacterized protein n=1 Tax=Riccia sorocarpa TaxID=122646 RepID=A0ABD3HUU5_9MARC
MRIIGETDYGEYGVWETIDDNGFIYKRRKKADLNSEKLSSQKDLEVKNQGSSRAPKSEHFEEKKLEFFLQQSEEDQRCRDQLVRKIKIAMLQEQKRKYVPEVESWQEILNEREGENVRYTEQVPEVYDFPSRELDVAGELDDSSMLELQVQVEIFEGFVKKLKREHDNVDEIVHKLEEKIKNENSFRFKCLMDDLELLRNSPRSLVGSLTTIGASPLAKGCSLPTEFGRLWVRTPKSGEPSPLYDKGDRSPLFRLR